jgi:hypothetical protein
MHALRLTAPTGFRYRYRYRDRTGLALFAARAGLVTLEDLSAEEQAA